MAFDIIHDNWGPYTHAEVEEALKSYLSDLDQRINDAIQEGGVGLSGLAQEVLTILDKANTALQPGSIAEWAKAQNKPGYTVSEITYNNLQTLAQKLTAIDAEISAKYTKPQGGIPASDLAPGVIPDTSTLQPKLIAGDGIAIAQDGKTVSVETGAVEANVDLPVSGGDVYQALDGITAGQNIVSSVENVSLIDNRYTNTILAAPTMRQFVMACANIDALITKVNYLFGLLAGIAFTDTKPSSLGLSANWSTPAIPTHTITVGTMTDVTLSKDSTSYVAGDEITANEGECTVTLTPASGKAIADTAIHIQLNGNDIPFTRSGNNVTFVLSGDVTISAIAAGGINIDSTALTGVNVDKVSALINTAEIITLSLPPHHQWSGNGYQDVVVKYGTAENTAENITNSCGITSQNNGNIEVQLPTNLSDTTKTIYISGVTAEENDKLTFTWDAAMTATKNSVPANSGFTVYSDEVSVQSPCVVKFTPVTGKKWAENGTPSATGQTFIQDGNSYKLEISNVPSTANVTVSATVENIPMRTITLPTIGNGIESVELQDLDGNTIEANEDIYSVPEGSGVKIIATPSTFYRLSVDSENSSMGNEQGDWYSESEESDYTLTTTIAEVSGDVILVLSKTNYNYDYKGLRYVPVSWNGTNSGSGTIFVFGPYGTNTNNCSYFLSKLIDIREINSVQFHCASNADSDLSLRLYRNDFSYAGVYSYNAVDRIVSRDAESYPIPSYCAYCRLFTTGENAATAWIKTGANSESLEPAWQGGNDVVSNAKTYTNFIASPFAVLAQVQERALPLLESDEEGIINNIYRVSGNDSAIDIRGYYSRNTANACWGRMTTGSVMNNKAVSLSPVINLPNPSGTLKLKLAAGTLSNSSGCRPQMMFYVPSTTNDMAPSECNEITSVGMEKDVDNAYKGGSLRLMFERAAYDRDEVYVKDITDANNEVQLWPPVSNEE